MDPQPGPHSTTYGFSSPFTKKKRPGVGHSTRECNFQITQIKNPNAASWIRCHPETSAAHSPSQRPGKNRSIHRTSPWRSRIESRAEVECSSPGSTSSNDDDVGNKDIPVMRSPSQPDRSVDSGPFVAVIAFRYRVAYVAWPRGFYVPLPCTGFERATPRESADNNPLSFEARSRSRASFVVDPMMIPMNERKALTLLATFGAAPWSRKNHTDHNKIIIVKLSQTVTRE